jgi:hypothetical protein
MERLQRLFGSAAGIGQGMQPGMDTPTVDNAEMVYISSLALLKVLSHIPKRTSENNAIMTQMTYNSFLTDAQAWLVHEIV